ncbi:MULTISPECIES: hypothetical protein [Bradyrhizobium]|nr:MULTISPECIES: hypothetical protein [Bradyrhizobium]
MMLTSAPAIAADAGAHFLLVTIERGLEFGRRHRGQARRLR